MLFLCEIAMHFTLHALLLILVVIPIPALQATQFKKLLSQTSKQKLTTLQSQHLNQTIPTAASGLGIGIGLAVSYLHAQEENEQPNTPEAEPAFSIIGLDLRNPQAVIEAFQKAPEAEKQLLAKKIAHQIGWYAQDVSVYTVANISTFLQHTTQKPHRILITALAKNITRFTPADITHILKADNQEETHACIAQALKENYTAFTSYSFYGVPLTSNHQWRRQYAAILKVLKPEHQGKVLQPILEHIEEYNIFDLLYYADQQHKQTILKAFEEVSSINLDIYDGCQLHHLLELTKPLNQRVVAQAIVATIDTYNGWHFHGMFKLCTEESKKIILKAIADRLHKNIQTYDATTLSIIQEMAIELPQEPAAKHITETIQAKQSTQEKK